MSTREHSCYSDELQDKGKSGGSKRRRCCITCAVAVAATLAVLGISVLVTWYMLFGQLDTVAAEAVKAGRIKERMIRLSICSFCGNHIATKQIQFLADVTSRSTGRKFHGR